MTRQEALAIGAARYHGKPCVKCTGTSRYARDNICTYCSAEAQRRRRLSDPEKYKKQNKKYNDRHKHKRKYRTLEKKYGLTKEKFFKMLEEQGFSCAICSGDISGEGKAYVDHCHTHGHVRALLCLNCNAGIGQLRDDPVLLAEATVYLLKHQVH